jgi:hypothetical protein
MYKKTIHLFSNNRFLFLFVSILGLLLIYPILTRFVNLTILLQIFITAILFATIYSIYQCKRHLAMALILLVPMLASTWSPLFTDNMAFVKAGRFFGIMFFILAIVRILNFIYGEEEVTKEMITAAMVVYLLMAGCYVGSYLYVIRAD